MKTTLLGSAGPLHALLQPDKSGGKFLANSLSILQSLAISYFYSFKESFLYYPVIFAIASFALFLITSRLDEIYGASYYTDGDVITSYLEPAFFAGSPNAARSILSTIASGWVTILGVAFSVTLITLQLTVTKFAAEVINEFQNSRVNQLTLAMFIFVVTFSLLVLKTVRTGEDGSPTFTPILGVNIAVYSAVVALFMLVIFLNNISTYLKPDRLIGSIVNKVIRSIKKYEKRVPDRRFGLDIKGADSGIELLAIKSPRKGIIRSIDWDKISNHIRNNKNLVGLEHEEPQFLLKWLSATGDLVEKDAVVVKLYSLGDHPKSLLIRGKNTELIKDALFAGLDIAPARRIPSDPHLGLEILRNIALRAISQSDIDVATSCISGLFSILYGSMKTKYSASVPFMIPINTQRGRHILTVSTRERDIAKDTLAQLSIIYHVSSTSDTCRINIAEHFAKNYTRFGKFLLDEENIEGFDKLTGWYSRQLHRDSSLYPSELKKTLKDTLVRFADDVKTSHPYATDSLQIHLAQIFASEA